MLSWNKVEAISKVVKFVPEEFKPKLNELILKNTPKNITPPATEILATEVQQITNKPKFVIKLTPEKPLQLTYDANKNLQPKKQKKPSKIKNVEPIIQNFDEQPSGSIIQNLDEKTSEQIIQTDPLEKSSEQLKKNVEPIIQNLDEQPSGPIIQNFVEKSSEQLKETSKQKRKLNEIIDLEKPESKKPVIQDSSRAIKFPGVSVSKQIELMEKFGESKAKKCDKCETLVENKFLNKCGKKSICSNCVGELIRKKETTCGFCWFEVEVHEQESSINKSSCWGCSEKEGNMQ